MDLLMD